MYSIIQGNKDKHTKKWHDFKIHEAVQKVTPIKYHVKNSNKTDPEEKKKKNTNIQIQADYKISPDQPHSDLNYI